MRVSPSANATVCCTKDLTAVSGIALLLCCSCILSRPLNALGKHTCEGLHAYIPLLYSAMPTSALCLPQQTYVSMPRQNMLCWLDGAGDVGEVETTPRRSRQAPERFTVDSYDGRSKDIRKYHRSETLVQNVDSLSLRNRTVLTPSPTEVHLFLSKCASFR